MLLLQSLLEYYCADSGVQMIPGCIMYDNALLGSLESDNHKCLVKTLKWDRPACTCEKSGQHNTIDKWHRVKVLLCGNLPLLKSLHSYENRDKSAWYRCTNIFISHVHDPSAYNTEPSLQRVLVLAKQLWSSNVTDSNLSGPTTLAVLMERKDILEWMLAVEFEVGALTMAAAFVTGNEDLHLLLYDKANVPSDESMACTAQVARIPHLCDPSNLRKSLKFWKSKLGNFKTFCLLDDV